MCAARTVGPGAAALGAILALLASTALLAGAQSSGRPTTIVGRMGLTMSETAARHAIAFRPFAPPRRLLAVALLPPFHGDDTRANRGIGFEYADATDRRYALAQWPANGGTIERFEPLADPEPGCSAGRTFPRGTSPNGIVWSTSHGLIMTLQADGANDARTLEKEWQKLIRRGACR